MRVLVGVQGGGMNGIDAYAEQVAVAGAEAGHEVTLLASSPGAAETVRARLEAKRSRVAKVIDIGLPEPTKLTILADRLSNGMAMRRIAKAADLRLKTLSERFDIAHLNRPVLAPTFRPWARAVVVAAWFYPHDPFKRVAETWNHTRGALPRRVVLAMKAVSYYWSDVTGYPAADLILAPTERLACHLCEQGLKAVVCPPPVQIAEHLVSEGNNRADESGRVKRLVACAGDLTHPRKNLAEAIGALHLLAGRLPSTQRLAVEFIGRNHEALAQQARNLPSNIEVSFPGPLPPAEVHRRMSSADALLLPSLYEEWGYVAVEALLLGTPVVAYPVYPFEYMLTGGLGFVAKERTSKSFADAIEQAIIQSPIPDLSVVAASKFGSAAIGERLSKIWEDQAQVQAAFD